MPLVGSWCSAHIQFLIHMRHLLHCSFTLNSRGEHCSLTSLLSAKVSTKKFPTRSSGRGTESRLGTKMLARRGVRTFSVSWMSTETSLKKTGIHLVYLLMPKSGSNCSTNHCVLVLKKHLDVVLRDMV